MVYTLILLFSFNWKNENLLFEVRCIQNKIVHSPAWVCAWMCEYVCVCLYVCALYCAELCRVLCNGWMHFSWLVAFQDCRCFCCCCLFKALAQWRQTLSYLGCIYISSYKRNKNEAFHNLPHFTYAPVFPFSLHFLIKIMCSCSLHAHTHLKNTLLYWFTVIMWVLKRQISRMRIKKERNNKKMNARTKHQH